MFEQRYMLATRMRSGLHYLTAHGFLSRDGALAEIFKTEQAAIDAASDKKYSLEPVQCLHGREF